MRFQPGDLVLDISKTLRNIAIAACSLMFCLAVVSCADTTDVRRELLKQTPIGSSMEQVADYCAKLNLRLNRSNTSGYLNQETGETVGKKSIWATIDERKTNPLMVVTVVAYWGFDENGKLLDIWVWKVTDAP
jgi:hypothetical protein